MSRAERWTILGTVIGTGVVGGGLILTVIIHGHNTTAVRFNALDDSIAEIRQDIREIRGELRDLNSRVARLEGLHSAQPARPDDGPAE